MIVIKVQFWLILLWLTQDSRVTESDRLRFKDRLRFLTLDLWACQRRASGTGSVGPAFRLQQWNLLGYIYLRVGMMEIFSLEIDQTRVTTELTGLSGCIDWLIDWLIIDWFTSSCISTVLQHENGQKTSPVRLAPHLKHTLPVRVLRRRHRRRFAGSPWNTMKNRIRQNPSPRWKQSSPHPSDMLLTTEQWFHWMQS